MATEEKDLFSQIVLHEQLIQSFLLQFDINPKLYVQSEWIEYVAKTVEELAPYKFNPVTNPNCPSKIKEIYNGFVNSDVSEVLKTGKIGRVLPTISAKYGTDRNIALMVTMNQDIFKEGYPDAPPHGFHISK